MKKNDIYEIEITDIGAEGEGIGHITHPDGKIAVFVKDTIVGDVAEIRIVKLKKSYAYGRLERLIASSPHRVCPACSKARQCGGCTLMHMSYDRQLAYKWDRVRECLCRIGGISNPELLMEPVCGMDNPYNYRNKMQFPVGLSADGRVEIGFYAGRTHSIIDLESCAIGHPVNDYIISCLRGFLADGQRRTGEYIYDENAHRGLVRHILTRVGFSTGELMVCLVLNGSRGNLGGAAAEAELVRCIESAVTQYNGVCNANNLNVMDDNRVRAASIKLASLSININRDKTNKILGDRCETLYGKAYITDYIGDIKFRISPMSFYQVNPVQTKVLYDKAVSFAELTGDEIVWDMYCGIGTISLCLAKYAKKVYGVEIIPQAIEDARENARINGIDNVTFFCGRAEEVVPSFYEGRLSKNMEDACHPDVVVVDPPRKGCDSILLDTIVKMNPDRIVYVSCDPATLARDVRLLGENGYTVKKVGIVDQFGHSKHVETVVKLSLKTDTPKFEVIMKPDEESNYTPEEKVTYQKIKEYIFEKYGLKVHSLYIAQIKDKCGLNKERKGNNWKKNEDARVPQCTLEKEAAIMDAFMHFGMI